MLLKRLLILTLAFMAAATGNAQESLPPGAPGFAQQFSHADFYGKFSKHVANDNDYQYFVTDMRRIPARFERVWFMEATFKKQEIVNIEFAIDEDFACFKSYKSHDVDTILNLFEKLFKESQEQMLRLDSAARNQWLKNHDKYQQPAAQ